MTPDSKPERQELLVSLSVAVLISSDDCQKLLLVKDRETGKWQPPAGGLKWLDDENRIETFAEGLDRELEEETGIKLKEPPQLLAVVNIPGKNKHHIGAVYSSTVEEDELKNISPIDTEEIEEVRLFSEEEVVVLLRGEDKINRPQFNRGLIVWWLKNECRSSWDPYLTPEVHTEEIKLDEKYLRQCELEQY